jgi:hypothetical protein
MLFVTVSVTQHQAIVEAPLESSKPQGMRQEKLNTLGKKASR